MADHAALLTRFLQVRRSIFRRSVEARPRYKSRVEEMLAELRSGERRDVPQRSRPAKGPPVHTEPCEPQAAS